MTTSTTPAALRRPLTRFGIGAGAAFAVLLALPGVAQAHVSIQPGTTEGGGFSVIAFRVPNERDDASTTRLQVTLPEDQPIGSVQTTAIPGWRITTQTRRLDEPIDLFGEQLDSVVSKVTWTATAGGIRPGQFQDFDLSLGPLPDSGELVFNARQTYSSGERVDWNEVSADGSTEPEHPAPTLTIGATAADQPATGDTGAAATGDDQSAADQADQAAPAATDADEGGDDSSTLAVVLSGAALLVSILAVALAWRGRRPAERPASPETPSRENVNA